MSATTLARVESGEHLPDRENLLRLARWAEVALPTQRVTSGNDIHGPDASTIEAIELHLRADKDLAQDDAEMLLEIVKAAYDRLAGKQR